MASARAGDGSFLFLGRLCLDLADTGGRYGYEALRTPGDLQRWLRAALSVDTRANGLDLRLARDMRAAVWDLIEATLAGRSLPAAPLDTVNRSAAVPPLAPRLDSAGTVTWARPATAGAALSTVARDLVDLVAYADRSRIRVCAEPSCQLVFYDDSRSGGRRWCAPERCGDRVRARAYRRRHRQH